MLAGRVRDHLGEVQRRQLLSLRRDLLDVPVDAALLAAVRAQPQPRAGPQLLRLAVGAPLVGDPVVEQRRDEGAVVDREPTHLGRERLELGGEHRGAAAADHEQRLDAELVADQGQLPGALVEDAEREHAAQPGQAVRAPAPERLQHDLGVRGPAEAHARRRQLTAQLRRVVQLAVVGDGEAVGDHGLGPGLGQVDDGQPPVSQVDIAGSGAVGVAAGTVRPAVRERVGEPVGQRAAVGPEIRACDAAHGFSLPLSRWSGGARALPGPAGPGRTAWSAGRGRAARRPRPGSSGAAGRARTAWWAAPGWRGRR